MVTRPLDEVMTTGFVVSAVLEPKVTRYVALSSDTTFQKESIAACPAAIAAFLNVVRAPKVLAGGGANWPRKSRVQLAEIGRASCRKEGRSGWGADDVRIEKARDA